MNTQAPVVISQSVELVPVFYRDRPVITLAMMDRAHARPEGTARKRFNDHKAKLIEDADYFVRNSDEAKTELGIIAPNGLILLAEDGYLMLVKSFTDDLAWQVQRQLVKGYFRTPAPKPFPGLSPDQQRELSQAIHRAVGGLGMGEGAPMWLGNALRCRFQVEHLHQLSPEQLPLALAECRRVETSLSGYFRFRAEMHDYIKTQILGAGTPWTPRIAARWKAKYQQALPHPVDWLALDKHPL